MSFQINGRKIAPSEPVYFVADIASNHAGDLTKAKELLHACAEARVDAVKMQNFTAETIVSAKGFDDLQGVKTHQSGWKTSVFDSYAAASIPLEWTKELAGLATSLGMDYFTTPYSPALTAAVAPHVCAFKIGSGDITWTDNIRAIAAQMKPVLLATGASDMDDVERAVEAVFEHHRQVLLMQCNTDYTANLSDSARQKAARFGCINLRVLETFRAHWPDIVVGLSDHTHGPDTVVAASALFGCSAVEKHFTLDNTQEGQDHSFSMTPASWKEMVERTEAAKAAVAGIDDEDARKAVVRDFMDEPEFLEAMIGDGVKKLEANEEGTVIVQRRSVCARSDLAAGTTLSADDLDFLRPCPADAFAPWRRGELLGRTLGKNVAKGQPFTPADFS